ncbi:DNA polymerase IV [Candidatus Parcubacteria bacterium]|nr:DNA polymerase IV [Candidatus Parcubacteria bacterium]
MWKPLLHSFPRAILHVDGDAFFVGCEVARDPSLRGKCVVTGKERGIASALSYEAKRKGVTRGMKISDVLKVCPDAIILPSDYESYSLYSKRMYEIVRRYTPDVEEYSIDECFADLTGLRRTFRMPYPKIAERIKHDLQNELGITFSVGLGPTKVLAKVASKWKKPDGLTVISGKHIEKYLKNLPTIKVWGIGPNTSAYLEKYGVRTALEFIQKEEWWIKDKVSKPYHEIWHELRGVVMYPIVTGVKREYKSISKTKTFTPPSTEREFVFSQLSKNIENACIKARRHGLISKKVFFYLKTQSFDYAGLEVKLSHPVGIPLEIVTVARQCFDELFHQGVPYRATGVVLMDLIPNKESQQDLFGETLKIDSVSHIYKTVDALADKFGKHTVFLGSSFKAITDPQHRGERGVLSHRVTNRLKGESKRQHLSIPLLGEVR